MNVVKPKTHFVEFDYKNNTILPNHIIFSIEFRGEIPRNFRCTHEYTGNIILRINDFTARHFTKIETFIPTGPMINSRLLIVDNFEGTVILEIGDLALHDGLYHFTTFGVGLKESDVLICFEGKERKVNLILPDRHTSVCSLSDTVISPNLKGFLYNSYKLQTSVPIRYITVDPNFLSYHHDYGYILRYSA